MIHSTHDKEPARTVRDLYAHLDDEQIKEVEETLDRYLELALRIYERIRADPEAYAQFRTLTDSKPDSSMHDERSSPSPSL